MSRVLALVGIFWIAFAAREVSTRALAIQRQPVPLKVSLAELPMDIVGEGWVGENVPLDEAVIQRAQVSEYVQRNYWRSSANIWLYVGYVDRWKPGAIHHPEICYPGNGFELVSKQDLVVPSPPELDTPLGFKELVWTNPRGGGTYTLFSFYYNGKFEPNDWRLRMDSVAGVRYFAVVTLSGSQLSSVDETRAVYQRALKKILPVLLRHFAD